MRSKTAAFGTGAVIGTLGGLVGLGGAEFRLPILIGLFKFRGLEAVVLNKATSLIVVATALLFRARTVPFAEVGTHWPTIVNLLAGSLVGAYFGASWATRLKSETLYKIIAVLLVLIAAVLLFAHDAHSSALPFDGWSLVVAGVAAGFAIGVVASLLGVAGGEFLIPTLILLFGAEVKLAGSLSLAVSLPTMLVGFARYSRDQSFIVIRSNWQFMLVMATGSMVGTFVGGRLLGIVPSAILLPALAAILLISSIKVWRHT
ncbi:MAG: sulfite exporter TauE/SafE family protein [Bradyrhizobium sp.]|nr:sulfite exporter TauE/SafE family protein [Bradyrhizobium sp.]